MKKTLLSIFSVMLLLGSISCATLSTNPKLAACKEGCQTTLDKCKEEAGDDKAKIKACEVAYDACCEKCRREY